MFGGHGLYLDDRFIAIIFDDVLYLKADAVSRGRFAAAGAEPFRYRAPNGRDTETTYFSLPAAVLEDREALLAWAREALAAAMRSQQRKKERKTR
jgi:DNA transformation protein